MFCDWRYVCSTSFRRDPGPRRGLVPEPALAVLASVRAELTGGVGLSRGPHGPQRV